VAHRPYLRSIAHQTIDVSLDILFSDNEFPLYTGLTFLANSSLQSHVRPGPTTARRTRPGLPESSSDILLFQLFQSCVGYSPPEVVHRHCECLLRGSRSKFPSIKTKLRPLTEPERFKDFPAVFAGFPVLRGLLTSSEDKTFVETISLSRSPFPPGPPAFPIFSPVYSSR